MIDSNPAKKSSVEFYIHSISCIISEVFMVVAYLLCISSRYVWCRINLNLD